MNTTIKRIGAGVATAALLAFSSVPAAFAADSTVYVAGNGAFSDSDVDVSNSHSKSVSQNNDTRLRNEVSNYLSTGGNHASFNTGGSVTIHTGEATAVTDISNAAGSNVANVSGCGCESGGTDVVLSGNGAFSSNDVSVSNWDRESFKQSNRTNITNEVVNRLSTGKNYSDFNTGTDVVIWSGDASAHNDLMNQAGSNVLH